MNMNMKYLLLTSAIAAAGLTFSTAQAATVTANMPVQITIENACVISVAPTLLQFGTHGVLAANIDSTSTMSVICTTGALYDIGLNAGLNGAGLRRHDDIRAGHVHVLPRDHVGGRIGLGVI